MCRAAPEFPLGRRRCSQNLFICSSLSLYVPFPHTPLADRSPWALGGRKWGPTAGCASPRSASQRCFNGTVVLHRRSVRAAVGWAPRLWVNLHQFIPRRWGSWLMMLADSGASASALLRARGSWPVRAPVVGLSTTPLLALGFLSCSILCTLITFSRAEGHTEMWELVCVAGSEPQDWQHTWRPQAAEQAWSHSLLLNLPQISSSPDPPLTGG